MDGERNEILHIIQPSRQLGDLTTEAYFYSLTNRQIELPNAQFPIENGNGFIILFLCERLSTVYQIFASK